MATFEELEYAVVQLARRYHPLEQVFVAALGEILAEIIRSAPDPDAKAKALRHSITVQIDRTRIVGPDADSPTQASVQEDAVRQAGALMDLALHLAKQQS
ncbi:MAG: hypothetical protein CML67_01980 [Rhodobacteraceae bacterium]|nr:hypothetical protein [Paracoccaceae bacterium]